jgi:hypothetical protein
MDRKHLGSLMVGGGDTYKVPVSQDTTGKKQDNGVDSVLAAFIRHEHT